MTIERRDGSPRIRIAGLGTPVELGPGDLDRTEGAVDDVAAVVSGFSGAAVPMAALLEAVIPGAGATHCTVASDDGHYRASIPLTELRDKGWLLFGSVAEPLARESGGPFRLVVPDGRTLCWNVKGVRELRFTAGPEPDSVPENPPH